MPFNKETSKERIPSPETLPPLEKKKKELSQAQPEKKAEEGHPLSGGIFPLQEKEDAEKAEISKEIEDILTQDLEPFYQVLPSKKKELFDRKKEQTIIAIEKTLSSTKIIAQKILNLVKGLLKMLPGLNRFFLEKESKIKTDKILSLVKKNEQIQL